jgi:hypothetical protein
MIDGRSLRRKRKHKPSMVNFAPMTNVQEIYEPQLFEEVKGRSEWKNAMAIEHESLMKNQTLDLPTLPPKEKPIRCKWVYKAQLVAKGFLARKH